MDTYLNYANASPAQFGATFGGSYFNPLEGQSSNILDSIIGRRMENVEPMRAKIRKFYEQEQMQKQQKELAEERDKQAKIGATVQAVKEGASLFEKLKAVETPEMGGGGAGTGSQTLAGEAGRTEASQQTAEQLGAGTDSQTLAGEAGRTEASQQTAEQLGETQAQYERLGNVFEEKAKNVESEGDVSELKDLAGTMKGLGQTGLSLYGNLMNIENRGNWQDYAGAGVNTASLVGQGMKLANAPGANLMSSGAGAAGSVVGLASGVEGITKDPSNPANYMNTGISGYQLGSQLPSLASPTASAITPQAMTTTATGQLAAPMAEGAGATGGAAEGGTSTGAAAGEVGAGIVMAAIAAAEALRGSFGGVGKTYDEQSAKEFPFNTPVAAVLAPGAKLAPKDSLWYDYGKALSGGERVVMAPINYLFGDKTAFDGKAFDDLLSGLVFDDVF
jgi:hypothetical protein